MADPPDQGFLPPEPPGPEPELGKRPEPQLPPEPHLPPHQPPPPGWGQPPPTTQQWGWQQPPPWAPQGGWGPQPIEPDNGPAVTGFVLAMVSAGLWVLSAGLATLLSLGLAIAGLIVSRTGKRNVAEGRTRRNKGLAQAGFISSIVMIVLATLSTIAWAVFFILLVTDDDFRREFENGNDNDTSPFDSDGITTTVRVGVVAVRAATRLLT